MNSFESSALYPFYPYQPFMPYNYVNYLQLYHNFVGNPEIQCDNQIADKSTNFSAAIVEN